MNKIDSLNELPQAGLVIKTFVDQEDRNNENVYKIFVKKKSIQMEI